jgi:hypothetical protein
MRQLKKMMLFKIHSTYINLMREPVIRMAHRSVQWIVQEFLFQRYGRRLTPLEMEEVHKRLDYFYYPDTQTLPEHFSLHVQAHNTALSNDTHVTPFSERDKVAKLRGSLIHCGLYSAAIDAWTRQYPTMIAVQTFQNLQDAIQIADNNRDRLATAVTNGYGVAAVARPISVVSLPSSDNSLLLEQFAQCLGNKNKNKNLSNPKRIRRTSIAMLMDSVPILVRNVAPPGLLTMSRQQRETPWVELRRSAEQNEIDGAG